jgi:uncharacterized linocin/CFP29 family protein
MNAVDNWSADVWKQINGQPAQNGQTAQPGLLKSVMGTIRVAQKVFPTTIRGNDNALPADTIDLKTGIPTVGVTRPVVLITKQFQLADLHVKDLPGLPMVMNQVSLAGQTLALLEDTLFFQGQDAKGPFGVGVTVTGASDLQYGLLGIAKANSTIKVQPDGDGVYGTKTFDAVTQGISQFAADLQGPPYALILDPATFADAHLPLEDDSMVTPASAIQALVADGGFYMSPGMPPKTGLLASLGGSTTKLYIGTDPVVQFTNMDSTYYYFTARESIQFYNIDPRSLIELDFLAPKGSEKKT